MSDPTAPRYFAIIPAAGDSRRMGQPKLLLPVQGKPLIAHTIGAWLSAGLTPHVVVKQNDELLADTCRQYGALVIQPEFDPPEMKISVQVALERIERTEQARPGDACLLAPADMPRLSPAIIRKLIATHSEQVNAQTTPAILVPTLAGKRGHPVLFPWSLASDVAHLERNEGINALVARHATREIPCDELLLAEPFADVDTPADYERFK
jgi:molybdenum cofactor cytidylyltransferase